MPSACRLLARALVALTVAYAVLAASGAGTAALRNVASRWGTGALMLGAVVLMLARAARERRERLAWTLLALGLAAWQAGNQYYWVVLEGLEEPPFPSPADAGFLALLPLAYAAIVLLVRARMPRFPASVWLDGLVGATAVAALTAALVLEPVLSATDGDLATVATNLAYPVGDLLLLAFTAGVYALSGWRPGRTWALLAAGLVVFAVTDVLYLAEVAAGTYATGGPLDVGWPAGSVLMALAAWQRPREGVLELRGLRVLVVPFAFAVAALGLLVAAAFTSVGPVAVVLAGATVLAAFGRTALTFVEVRALAETRRQALTDDLTGLGNRRFLYQRLDALLAAGGPHGVLMLDLDRFKELNDTLGHLTGDRVLTEVAHRLAGAAPAGAAVVRTGGDEFAIIVPGAGEPEAVAVAARVHAALATPVAVEGLELAVDTSVGVALAPRDGATAGQLLQRADVAMYQAKADSSGTATYASDRDRHSRDSLALVGELKQAIAGGELVLHYQPKVAVTTGAVVGVEALVRWEHPERGLLGPGAFIALAEHTGLIKPITLQVLEGAIADCARRRAAGDELTVAVNLAAANLVDAELPAIVAAALARHGVPPSALVLEITESSVLSDAARGVEVVEALRRLGVGFALDDFGTGYSSLTYLRRLAVDEVKIDRSFVLGMTESEEDAVIVRSTIDLARNLELRVVAEGVEDAAALACLAEWGCDVAQGYHVARPLPAAALDTWLAARRVLAA